MPCDRLNARCHRYICRTRAVPPAVLYRACIDSMARHSTVMSVSGYDRTADVVVVGAGVVGMSIAWHLSDAGVRCLIVERDAIGCGATNVQAGGVRTQWTAEETCRMALESQAFYRSIDRRLRPRVRPAFDACGYVFVATEQATMSELERAADRQRRLGTPTSVRTPVELAKLVDGLATAELVGGTYNPEDGYFDRPRAVAHAFADAAFRNGARMRVATVVRIDGGTGRWLVQLGDGDRLAAQHVVVAAGLDTPGIVRSVGVGVPIRAEPRYMFFSTPRPPFLVRPLLVFQDQHFVVKHLADGRVLASDLRYGSDGGRDDDTCRAAIGAMLRRFVGPLEGVGFPQVVPGAYDVTPDYQLVVGPVPGHPGLWLAGGMNGRGMMLAPSVGRMLTESIVSGDRRAIPPSLLPERFTDGRDLPGERQML